MFILPRSTLLKETGREVARVSEVTVELRTQCEVGAYC